MAEAPAPGGALLDRLMGGLIGPLGGEALGVPVEFTGRSVRDQNPVTGMRGSGTFVDAYMARWSGAPAAPPA